MAVDGYILEEFVNLSLAVVQAFAFSCAKKTVRKLA